MLYGGRRCEENEVSLPPTQPGAVSATYVFTCRGERASDPQGGSRCAGSLPGPGSFHLTRGARGLGTSSGAAGWTDPYRSYGVRRQPSAQPTEAELPRRSDRTRSGARRAAWLGSRRGCAPAKPNGPAPSEAREGPATSSRSPLVAIAIALLCAACAVNPVSGRRELILVSREQEQAAGREGAEQVAAAMGIFADARLSAYIAAVGERVAAHSPREQIDWRFEIVDQALPNAFALPDGHMYVSRGLLELANSEDELAGVLAHEVVHVAARHHAQQQTRATGVGLLALPALLAGAVLGGPVGQVVQAPLLVLGAGVVASYGRDQEREADRVGQRLAALAGYDPAAFEGYLATLARWSEGQKGRTREPGFFDTHPSTPERIASSRENAATLDRQPLAGIAADRDAFLRKLEDLVVGENPAEGVFQGALFLQPELMFSLRFPEGWQTLNARSQVGAFSPDEQASVVLEVQGPGSDPKLAAKAMVAAIARDAPLELLRADALTLSGCDAFRVEALASGRRGATLLHLTWIAYGGLIYLVAGMVDAAHVRTQHAALAAAGDSFRPLEAADKGSIRGRRLRLARTRANEGLAALSRRTGSVWEPGYAALVNGLAPDAVPGAGRLVKIAVELPYARRSPEGGPSPGG